MIIMPYWEHNLMYVPALVENGSIIVPELHLGARLEFMIGVKQLTAAEAQKFPTPTLAELSHAFFGKYPDGRWVSPDYRGSIIFSPMHYSEFTSTFKQPREPSRGEVIPKGYAPIIIINRPQRIFCHEEDRWVAEYESGIDFHEPPRGYILKIDKQTGFPIETSPEKEDAEKIFGNDASYFYPAPYGLRTVIRCSGYGPFDIDATLHPGESHFQTGARSVCR